MPSPSTSSTAHPRVSIAIPVYNVEAYVAQAIESVLKQTWTDFELIIIDDASTDRTPEIIRSFADRDPRIRVLRNPVRLKMVGNWNRCLAEARGEYLQMVMADDLLRPGAVAAAVDMFERFPSAVLVSWQCLFIDAQGKPLTVRRNFSGTGLIPSAAAFRALMRCNVLGEPTSVCLRRSRQRQCGEFVERYEHVPDWHLWLRMLEAGDLAYVDSVLSCFRVHDKSNSAWHREEHLDILEHYLLIEEWLNEHQSYTPWQRMFIIFHLSAFASDRMLRTGVFDALSIIRSVPARFRLPLFLAFIPYVPYFVCVVLPRRAMTRFRARRMGKTL